MLFEAMWHSSRDKSLTKSREAMQFGERRAIVEGLGYFC